MAEQNIISDLREIAVAVTADDLAAGEIVRRIQRDWGGQQVYIPRRPSVTDGEILAAFTGGNHGEVIRRLGITRSRLYQALQPARLVQRSDLQQRP